MVKIRLKRMGKKGAPFYRLVVADARAPRDGKFIQEVGYFNPHSKEFKLDKPEILAWLGKGAQPTDTVKSILKKEHVLEELHQKKQVKSQATK